MPSAPHDLPPAVHVTTETRATTLELEYAVHDGRIYTKKKGAPVTSWRLIDDDGRPGRQDQPYDFAPIARISADDAGLTATTHDGYLVRYSDGWDGLWGLPAPGVGVRLPIQLPASTKSLAHSVRRGAVEYYEDVLGNQFNWGFAGTTSLYVLTDDGRILLGDPWLAPDLSRQVCAPLRGAFRGEGLAASASTIMVIGDDGAVWTTFHDYDSDGGTPFINYAYFDRAPRHGLSGSLRDSEYEVRALPAEEWTRQPDVPLSGRARLTRHVSILQNGKGNGARELRILGTGAGGEGGYWTKQLLDERWHFHSTGDDVDPEGLLDGHDPIDAHATERELAFSGGATLGGTAWDDVTRIEVSRFQFHCSPFLLDVHVAGGGVVQLAVHSADSWTPFAQGDAETDARAYKSMKGTLVVRGLVRPDGDSTRLARVVEMFQRAHLESFSYAIIATQRELEMIPLHRTFGTDPFRPTLRATRTQHPSVGQASAPAPASLARGGDPRVTALKAIALVDDARALADREAADAARAHTIATGGKVTSGFLNVWAAVSPEANVAWMQALALHMPAITVTMTRVQQREADDAARAKDDTILQVADAYCDAYARIPWTETAFWDGELLRYCP
jgi:hypothetical protein